MGYFSELDLEMREMREYAGYASFEDQLCARYEDLKDRYLKMRYSDAPLVGENRYSRDDYRYAPVETFRTLSDVYSAMEVVKEDLERKCGIAVGDDELYKSGVTERDPDQISMFEVVLLPSFFGATVAA